jgi:hypothetical protein
MTDAAPPLLQDFLRRYCHVEAQEMTSFLADRIEAGDMPEDYVAVLRTPLDGAVSGVILTPQEYKALTFDNECVTDASLRERMLEIRSELFPHS